MQIVVSANLHIFMKQIGPTPGGAEVAAFNVACKTLEFIANGLCTDGWQYHDGTDWVADSTVVLDCIGETFLLLHLSLKSLKKIMYSKI